MTRSVPGATSRACCPTRSARAVRDILRWRRGKRSGRTVDRIAGDETTGAERSDADLDWPATGRDYSEQRFSSLRQIDETNVGTRGSRGKATSTRIAGIEATPIMVDGVIYVTSTWSRVMRSTRHRQEVWTYDPQVPRRMARLFCCDVVNRGVAVANGKVFVGTLDGRLVALDAKSGKPVWTVDTIDRQSKPYTITGAPRVMKGKVSSATAAPRTACAVTSPPTMRETASSVWRFFIVPGDPAEAPENEDARDARAKTWTGRRLDATAAAARLGRDGLRSRARFALRRHRQRRRRGIAACAARRQRRQSVCLVDRRARSRHRRVVWHYQTTPGDSGTTPRRTRSSSRTSTSAAQAAQGALSGAEERLLLRARSPNRRIARRRTNTAPSNWASHVDMADRAPGVDAAGGVHEGKISSSIRIQRSARLAFDVVQSRDRASRTFPRSTCRGCTARSLGSAISTTSAFRPRTSRG